MIVSELSLEVSILVYAAYNMLDWRGMELFFRKSTVMVLVMT